MGVDRDESVLRGTLERTLDYCMGPNAFWTFLFLMFVGQLVGPAIDSSLVRLPILVFYTLFLISAIRNISSIPAVRRLAGLLVVVAVILRWADSLYPTPTITIWGYLLSLMVMISLTLVSIDRVFRDKRPVTISRVVGAVAVYVLFAMTWAYLYELFNLLLPGAFNLPGAERLSASDLLGNFTYFSFVTLTTLGYGDITPVHPVVRLFVVVQALFGQLYPATLLARLVSLEITSRQSSQVPEGDKP